MSCYEATEWWSTPIFLSSQSLICCAQSIVRVEATTCVNVEIDNLKNAKIRDSDYLKLRSFPVSTRSNNDNTGNGIAFYGIDSYRILYNIERDSHFFENFGEDSFVTAIGIGTPLSGKIKDSLRSSANRDVAIDLQKPFNIEVCIPLIGSTGEFTRKQNITISELEHILTKLQRFHTNPTDSVLKFNSDKLGDMLQEIQVEIYALPVPYDALIPTAGEGFQF